MKICWRNPSKTANILDKIKLEVACLTQQSEFDREEARKIALGVLEQLAHVQGEGGRNRPALHPGDAHPRPSNV